MTVFSNKSSKNPKYLKELLQVIFPPEVIEHARLDDIGIKDGELTKLASGPLHADLVVALRVSDGQT